MGGGTGTGFAAVISEHIEKTYSKKPLIANVLYPSPTKGCEPLHPINCVAGLAKMLDHATMVNLYDNEAMFAICQKGLSKPDPTL